MPRETPRDRFEALRERAERMLKTEASAEHVQMQEDVQKLIDELRMYQIELELQNDELRTAQQELGQSRERYRELFDHAPIGYVVFDRDGVVQDINLTGTSQLGRPRERVQGKPFLLYLQPAYRDLFAHHLQLTLRMEQEQTCEVIVERKGGTTFWARLQSMPFPGLDGEGRQVRTALINISAQKELEQELIAAREEAMQATQMQRAFLSSMSHEIRTPLTSVIGFADVLAELASDDQQQELARLIKGSCFTVSFPRVPAPPPETVSESASPAERDNRLPRWRVLLVDDQLEARRLVRLFLRHEAEIVDGETVEEALEAMEDGSFDAILLDIQLSDKETAPELLHRIRSLPAGHDMPVGAFTAYALPGDEERFEKAGFDAYLGKPFTKRQLVQTLRRVAG